MEKLAAALSLSKKAGKLVLGFDVVKEAVQNKKAALVLLSEDISPKTRKEVAFLCGKYSVCLAELPFKLDEIWYLIGKRAGVIAVTDKGLSEKIILAADEAKKQTKAE